jgi:hypothetical protein
VGCGRAALGESGERRTAQSGAKMWGVKGGETFVEKGVPIGSMHTQLSHPFCVGVSNDVPRSTAGGENR